ncbi:13036_t:CDS:2 [Ambispora gerdemannii]|uniref:Ribophorin II n=1 Tax=Ambispora gerdemannii TaxID=144530 RepID=A0A9N8ZW21_9GLOM|nr:13036_t:CDS:2 [Ambispora gerdemannii]
MKNTSNFFRVLWLFFLLVLSLGIFVKSEESDFAIKDVKIAVTDGEGVRKLSQNLAYPTPLSEILKLNQDDNLKMILTIKDAKTDKPIKPHQAFLSFTNKEKGSQVALIVQIRDNGKARVELDMKSAPTELLLGPADYEVDLIIGTFSRSNSIKYQIGKAHIDVPEKTLPPPLLVYGPRPEILHIFGNPERLPPMWLSYGFVLIAIAPWISLIISWSYLDVNLSFLTGAPNISSISFLVSLVAIEILFYNYWTHLNIFQTLSWLTGLSLLAFFTGQRALSDIQGWRLKGLR